MVVMDDVRHAKYQVGFIYHSRPNKDKDFISGSDKKYKLGRQTNDIHPLIITCCPVTPDVIFEQRIEQSRAHIKTYLTFAGISLIRA